MEVVTEEKIDLGLLERYAKLLDSSIRIPGTERTIGLDPILGLIPFVGDILGYLFSILVFTKAAQHGASKRLILKMLVNTSFDATIGAIPILGSVFDFFYKANDRNVRLLKEYHNEGKHRESTVPIFLGVALVLFLVISGFCYLMYSFITRLF